MASATGAPKLDEKELAASYGWAMATLNAVPELKSLFGKAVKKQYTPERFQAELRATKWFQSTAEPARKYLVLRTADPAEYVSRMKQTMAALADQYSGMTGEVMKVNYPSLKGGKIVNGQGFLAHVADLSLKLGWNEAQIKDTLFGAVKWKDLVKADKVRGQASANLNALREQAHAYGIRPSDDWYAYRLKNIAQGEDTLEGSAGLLKATAKKTYAHLATELDAGQTIADIAEPYRQSMARLLEMNPNEIDVFDKQIQAGLNGQIVDGKRYAATVNDFEKRIRQDDRWQFTQNAKDVVVGRTQSLLKTFGLAV